MKMTLLPDAVLVFRGAENLFVKVKPVLCTPEFHKPSLLVVEWELPVQTHFTVSLTLMVTVAGIKSKLSTGTLVVTARAQSE